MELLNIDQAAAYLHTPVGTLYGWRSQGRGPACFKIGRRVMYDRADLDAFLAACRQVPAEREAQA